MDQTFRWPDGDVILRATHRTDSRDFRVHKLILSLASPVFKDMFQLPQPPSATSAVGIIDTHDPPRALEVILRHIYPSTDSPAIEDLTLLSEVLALADKYDVGVARSQYRPLLAEFAKTEPLRVYAIACRLGYDHEMKIASSHSTSIHLPGLTELPGELKLIPAMEYHRLILLHVRYRKQVEAIATADALRCTNWNLRRTREQVMESIRNGTPLNYEYLVHAVTAKYDVGAEHGYLRELILFILEEAHTLDMTI